MNLYETLYLQKDATAAEIKAAYRSLAQQHHPDKGGDKAAFQAIQEAYAILSDDERRAEYDLTGQIRQQGPTLRERAMGVISDIIGEVLDDVDPDFDNVLQKAERIIKDGIANLVKQEAKLTAQRGKVEKAIKRTAAKEGKDDIVSHVLVHLLEKVDGPLKETVRNKAMCEMALTILQDHAYTVDLKPEKTAQGASMFDNARANQSFQNWGAAWNR
jgi:DnaJ-class molecular chaperone